MKAFKLWLVIEEKAPEEEDDSLHTQFELDVYQSMADTFGNIVTHPDQRDWMVDRILWLSVLSNTQII